jgi:hypothetical protein
VNQFNEGASGTGPESVSSETVAPHSLGHFYPPTISMPDDHPIPFKLILHRNASSQQGFSGSQMCKLRLK